MRPIAAALLLAAGTALAQAPAADAPPARPTVALVLSGGGARGIAHIGVLKVLRELRVPVDFVVATSMGSIVGGAYVAGRSPEEMEAFVRDADWALMFSDRPPRRDLSFRRKEDDIRFIGRGELGVKPGGLVLPRGAFGSNNLEEFLRLVSRHGNNTQALDRYPLPLRAVATDLESGELVVLRDVTLPVAMRASMSIPGLFAPTEVKGRLLGDGGLTRNLPVEVARDLGADIVIAVNVGTPLLPRAQLDSALGVAQQMVNILTEQNVGISLRALRPGDILVSPRLDDITFLDFERAEAIVERGVEAGRAAASRLAALSVSAREYDLWDFRRTRSPVEYDRDVAEIRIAGATRVNPQALLREMRERVGIRVNESVSDEQMAAASRILHGSGDFERVDVHAELEGGRKVVVVDVTEKSWGPDYLRFGGRAVSDFKTDGRFALVLQHTHTWVNAWGAEWRTELQLGDERRLGTSLYQPLGPGSPWFVEPLLQAIQSDSDIFEARGRRTDRVTNDVRTAALSLGRRIGNTAVVRVTGGYERQKTSPVISSRIDGPNRANLAFARVGAAYDTLDDANFPRAGALVSAETSSVHFRGGGGSPVQTWAGAGIFPATYGKLTFLALLNAAGSRDDRGQVPLGGFLNLSGTPVGAVAGSHAAIGSLLAYYRFGELPRTLGGAMYAGVSLEAGNAWQRRSQASAGDLRKATSVFLGMDTLIGPLYLGYGHTFGGDSALYLFLGRPVDRN